LEDRDRIRSYYRAAGPREWQRLDEVGDGAVELAVTCGALALHLPAGARVLDIGGGPGRYALWLARRGHPVSLGDLSPELVEIARQRVAEEGLESLVSEVAVVDACDLSRWADGSFDAALSLGPFYHLVEPADRERAAGELVRVLRPGGLAFVAWMPRQTFLRRTLAIPDERHHLLDARWLRRLLEDGVFENDRPGRFDCGYGARPEEIASFLAGHGLHELELLAVEGLATGLGPALRDLLVVGGPLADAAMRLITDSARDPTLRGAASHILYVGRRA
jgi:SAM-dependent methyltransferase